MDKANALQTPEILFRGPFDYPTGLFLFKAFKLLKGREWDEEEAVTIHEFELASQIGLGSEIPRHSPGNPLSGEGGAPVFDWIFGSTPYRNKAKRGLERLLGFWTPDSEIYVRRLLTPLVLWTIDLPASECNHHAYPYGLLDHCLEVMLAATMACEDELEWATPRKQRRHVCRQAIRLVSILSPHHDIGKVFSVEVKDEKSGEIWDPTQEPLAYFKARRDLPILDRTPFRFVKGRGLNGHEEGGRKLLPLVVHPKITRQMGPEIAQVYDAYAGRYESPAVPRPAPLDFIADQVHQADQASAARSCAKDAKPGEYLLELAAEIPELV